MPQWLKDNISIAAELFLNDLAMDRKWIGMSLVLWNLYGIIFTHMRLNQLLIVQPEFVQLFAWL